MTTKRYTPEKINIVSSADEIGAILDIPRINGESLQDYKKRILESSKKPSNSTYEGLVNAINRDLGLDRELAISVTPKKKYYNNRITDVLIQNETITDNRSFSGIIDGVNVICVGNKFTSTTGLFVANELIGLKLEIQGTQYKILSNTENSFIFDGEVSGLTNDPYQILANWEENELVGLALLTNSNKYVIISNSGNIIQTDTSGLNNHQISEFYIQSNSPRVHITSSEIVLYKDYVNEENFQLDKTIDLRIKGLEHTTLVDMINDSDFFDAENLLGHSVSRAAFTIKKQDSDINVYREEVPPSKFFRLENENLKEGSLKFSKSDVFFNETRDLEAAPFGPYYYVNYKEGIVQAKKVASGLDSTVSYVYMDFPFLIELSPAVITAFADETAEQFLFTQQEKRLYTDPRDKEMSIQPKSDMIEYIAELLETSRQSWGE